MNAKEFANLYGMTVLELADYTGYSRRALYNIFSGEAGCNDRRLNAMLRLLRVKAMSDLTDEKAAADELYRERMRAIENLSPEWQQDTEA